jgi:lysophospholipase L1-like esterase
MPASVSNYLASRAKAEAAKETPPAPAPEDLRTYEVWQAKRLTQDFGGLCRYQADNTSLPKASSHRVVYFGDSITELWAARDPGLFTNDTLDRGISGQTTSQMLLRFRADVIDLKPKAVHILAGTNDVAGNTGPTTLQAIKNNIMAMVEMAQTHHIGVVLGSILPAGKFGWRPSIAPVEPIRALNEWLKVYAAERKVFYADYYDAMKDDQSALKGNLADDGVHPNAEGYALMRPIAQKAIAQALAAH